MKKRLLLAVMAIFGIVLGAGGVANAATYLNYNVSSVGPTIYQSNLWYAGPQMQSPASTPSTAVVGDVTWNWTWNGGTPPGLQMQICDVQRCTTITSGFPSGTTSAFAGDPGVNTWQIKFEAKTSTTKVFSPYYYGGTDQLNVATTY